jgi:hypothetical protein
MTDDEITLCWNCSNAYSNYYLNCPVCLMPNANHDLAKAQDANQQREAGSLPRQEGY